MWTCPAHDDHKPSLSVKYRDGRVLLHCFAGCSAVAVASALNLHMSDLFDDRCEPAEKAAQHRPVAQSTKAEKSHPTPKRVEEYEYHGAGGRPPRRKVRFEPGFDGDPKSFIWEQPNGDRWQSATGDGNPSILYRLPGLLSALAAGDTVYVAAGEKDADRIECEGWPATTNPEGEGKNKWKLEYTQVFVGTKSEVRILADRDRIGYEHATEVLGALQGAGLRARCFEALEGNDVSNHLDAGFSLDDLVEVDPAKRLAEVFNEAASAPPSREGFNARILTATEFEADVLPTAYIEGFVYERSLHNVVGGSKVGKSILLTQAAMCIATGNDFLGLRTRKARVLFVNLEMGAALVRERINSIHRDTDLPIPAIDRELFVVAPTKDGEPPEIDVRTEAGREGLLALIEVCRAEVVILDTLYCFCPGADPSDNGEMGRVFRNLSMGCRRADAAFICLDHVSKAESSGETGGPVSHSALGAVLKGGACNVIAKLSKSGPAWTLAVDSHFGSWEEPLYYQRPSTPAGSGWGAVPTTLTRSRGIDIEKVQDLFNKHGQETTEEPRKHFPSLRTLKAAIVAAGWTSNQARAETLARSVERLYAVRHDAPAVKAGGTPILIYDGPRKAKQYVWIATDDVSKWDGFEG